MEKSIKLVVENHQLLNRLLYKNRPIYGFFKRSMDIVGASIGLVLLSPLFIIIALLITHEDAKGSIFFVQKRVGKDGKVFWMYKFRSMCVDAESQLTALLDQNEIAGKMFKMKKDPRITKIGRFIRKTSIDELPQLFNVLKGEMSLIGPRPPLENEVDDYSSQDAKRLLVKPGCSGLWQVSGRNQLSFEEMVALDVRYIQTRNLIFDILIIVKTIWVMIKPNGAY
ncbi:sugar transferase [Enterococcus alishanensis]|uniref:Sugar transferase n=1 Tax=Enterococcus alishanensis TaxID=1303817 RepID=A0ABS6TCM3_9ENTE|nr:sugar transferase [Enterococcus alishanensis]MBV7390637.1 sugar transferase [Enterococcus alishanensis]